MAHMTITLGRMLCGNARNFLDSEKFKGRNIEYLESKGFIERDFTIKGSNEDILYIKKCFHNWAKENDLYA